MKKSILRNSLLLQGLALAVMLTAISPASAQVEKDVKKDTKSVVVERSSDPGGEDESVRIEVKDGRTWVNGIEVPEGEDVSDYLPDGFDVSILDRNGRGRLVFDSDESRVGRNRRFLLSDDREDEDREWVDDSDRRVEVRASNRRLRPGSSFRINDDDGLMELRENLVEVGGDWGSRAAGFFADFGNNPTSPEIMKLEIESRRLGRELAQADGDNKQKLSAELDKLLSTIFEKKTNAREEALVKLKEKVKAEEEALASRKRDRQRMITQRKSDLTGESKKNDW